MSKVKVRNWLSSLLALVLIASSLYFPISKVSAEEVVVDPPAVVLEEIEDEVSTEVVVEPPQAIKSEEATEVVSETISEEAETVIDEAVTEDATADELTLSVELPVEALELDSTPIVMAMKSPPLSFNITYDLGGGTFNPLYIPFTTVNNGDSFWAPAVEQVIKTGYVLSSWTGSDGKTYEPGNEITPTADITLTAVWKETVSITYNLDGGSFEFPPQTDFTKGDKVNLPYTSQVKKTGYLLLSWKDTLGVNHNPGKELTVDRNLSLTAQWQKVEILTINVDGGTWIESYQQTFWESAQIMNGKNFMAGVALPEKLLKKDGFAQEGWIKENGASFTDADLRVMSSDTTIKPKWVSETVKVTIQKGDAQWGSGFSDANAIVYLPRNSYLDLPIGLLEKPGYGLDYYVDENGNRKTASRIDKDTVFTPVWIAEHTITIDPDGGSFKSTETSFSVRAGFKYYSSILSSLIEKSGHNVSAWKDEAGNLLPEQYVFEKNMTVKPVWTAGKTLTLDFSGLGADFDLSGVSSTSTVVPGDNLFALNNPPTSTGSQYIDHWLGADGTVFSGESIMPDGNLTLYPVLADKFTITVKTDKSSLNPSATASLPETILYQGPYFTQKTHGVTYVSDTSIFELEQNLRENVAVPGYTFVKLVAEREIARDQIIKENITLTMVWRERLAETTGNEAFTYIGNTAETSWVKIDVLSDTFPSKPEVHIIPSASPAGFEQYLTDTYDIYFTIDGEKVLPARPITITLPITRDPNTFIGVFHQTLDDRVQTHFTPSYVQYIAMFDSVNFSLYVMAYFSDVTEIETPTDPTDPSKPTDPTKPSDTTKTDSTTTKTTSDKKSLPRTGETSGAQHLGAMILLAATALFVIRRKLFRTK